MVIGASVRLGWDDVPRCWLPRVAPCLYAGSSLLRPATRPIPTITFSQQQKCYGLQAREQLHSKLNTPLSFLFHTGRLSDKLVAVEIRPKQLQELPAKRTHLEHRLLYISTRPLTQNPSLAPPSSSISRSITFLQETVDCIPPQLSSRPFGSRRRIQHTFQSKSKVKHIQHGRSKICG